VARPNATALACRAVPRITVLYNVDWEHYPPGAPSYESDADVKKTAESIAAALERSGHSTRFLTADADLAPVAAALEKDRPDLVFNLVESLGGQGGREAEVPEMLENLGIRYTGNSAHALRVSAAKDETRRVLAAAGVRVAPGFVVSSARELPSELNFPLFVKNARTDASIGIDQSSVARDRAGVEKKLAQLAANYPGPYLVEEYLPGKEVNVAIFPEPLRGNYVCTEIDFYGFTENQAPIVTYDCKWKPGTPDYLARSVPCAGRMAEALIRAAQEQARAAFLAIGASSYGRVDQRIGKDGKFYVIDINPNPDISSDAGLAIAARSIGIEHDALIAGFAEAALCS
jgi:D-alanine-D-alanine ligase